MKAKKWIAWLLCASMLVGLTACGEAGVKAHTEHKWDASTGVCTVGGETCTHRNEKGKYKTGEDGKCAICGYQSMFKWDLFKPTDDLLQPIENGGTIEKITYSTHDYEKEAKEGGTIEIEKNAYVYLPAGYDASKHYDVLYLMHGMGLTEIYWFAQGTEETGHMPDDIDYGNIGNHTKDLLDNMIAKELCKETIVVTPTFYSPDDDKGWHEDDLSLLPDPSYFAPELKNDLMPYIAENYATYAASGSSEDLIAARDHQAYAGLSWGSVTGWNSVLKQSVDYIGWVGNYSGGAVMADGFEAYQDIITALKGKYKDYKINYWYNGDGKMDSVHDWHVAGYDYMIEQCPEVFTNGYGTSGNATFVDLPQGLHGYTAWLVDLYNSMLKFFQD